MRLIDADKLIYEDVECTDGNTYMVVHAPMVDKQPAAYDVDKVVEQLDEYITQIVGRNSALYQTVMRIVKAGGKDEMQSMWK